MSFNVSALAEYVNQESTDLLLPLHFGGQTSQFVTLQPGVKHKDALQLFDLNAIPQDGSGCGFEPTGDGTFTQAEIEVKKIKYQSDWCLDDLRTKWTQKLLVPGSNREDQVLTFQQTIINEYVAAIVENNEYADWRGDTTASDSALQRYDGFLKKIDAASDTIDGNTGGITAGTGITGGSSGNADTIIFAMCDARPARMKGPGKSFVLFCGLDTFDKVVDTFIQKNNYHIDRTQQDASYQMQIPGRANVTLVGTAGLDGTNRLVLSYRENMFIGFDLMNDQEQFAAEYSQVEEEIHISVKYKRGVQIARTSDVVEFTLA